jgi:hypothetical protein
MAHYSFKECYLFLSKTKHPLTESSKPIDIPKYIDVIIIIIISGQYITTTQQPITNIPGPANNIQAALSHTNNHIRK